MNNEQTTTFLGTERTLRYTFKDSKILAYATYDTFSLSLLVIFHNGTQYEYSGVDELTWNEFINANSAGSYFNTVIRKFNYQRLK
jgi:hypothetical protein